jgi:hypothetical protein
MKHLLLAAFAALSLTAAIAPAANAAWATHTRTSDSPGQTGMEGGGG